MRKALFALVVVAASFAGGAAFNGPGARWTKALLHLVSRSDDDDEPAPVDLARVEEVSPAPGATVPASPIPPLTVEPDAAADASKEKPKGKAGAKGAAAPPGRAAAATPPAPAGPKPAPVPKAPEPLEPKPLEPLDPPAPMPDRAAGRSLAADSPRAKEDAAPPSPATAATASAEPLAPLEPPAPLPASGDRAAPGKGAGRDEPWADAPGSAPAAAVPPRASAGASDHDPAVSRAATDPTSAAAPAPAPVSAPDPSLDPQKAGRAGDWAGIRRKMADLGVTRYGVDGELGGRVRFHCVIPLAGRRAVGQQFEAEGDDLIDAAQTALRRVALWRATEEAAP